MVALATALQIRKIIIGATLISPTLVSHHTVFGVIDHVQKLQQNQATYMCFKKLMA